MARKVSKVLGLFALAALIYPNMAASFSRNLSLPAPPALQAQASEQEDPFYRKLYDEGKYFYENKNYAGAIEDFEVAFFGYLDNLPRLLECYVYLTVCHFQLKNYEKAKSYVDEIRRLKLEKYIKEANLPGDLVKKYEEIVTKIFKVPSK